MTCSGGECSQLSLSAGCSPETFGCGMVPSLPTLSEAQSDQLYEVFPLWVVGKGRKETH